MVTFKRHSASPTLAFHRSFLFSSENPDLEDLSQKHFDHRDIDSEDLPNPYRSIEPKYLATSCICIDDALAGGFLYGQINSLAADSADSSTERTLVAMHAVTTHLLSHPKAQAAWIDTEGKFSPVLLKTVIALRLPLSLHGVRTTVEDILDRVQIIRVFDIQGVAEVVDELKQDYEDREGGKVVERTDNRREKNEGNPPKTARGAKEADFRGSIGVVVIDTICRPLSELMDAELEEFQKEDEWAEDHEKPEAAGLFVALSRSLSLLAKERDICILFLNTTNFTPYDGDPFSRWNEVLPSAFITIEERPALGPVYAGCVDFSVMISKYPHDPTVTESLRLSNAQDTQERHCKEPTAAEIAAMIQEMELAGFKLDNIIEVVGDRNGSRGGMFGAFVTEGAKLIEAIEPNTDDSDDILPDTLEEPSFSLL